MRFDDAWRVAVELASDVTFGGIDIVLSRDLLGRVCLILDLQSAPGVEVDTLARRLTRAVGPTFVAPVPVVDVTATGFPADYFEPPLVSVRHERDDVRGRLALLENGLIGAPWRTIAAAPPNRRVTLYSYKGGVGRSTATFMLARELAERGGCVLVVDLDLESPGVGSLLLTDDARPEHGLVDHLVESLVDNEAGLDLVARSTSTQVDGNGEVWVAPASGRPRDGYSYLPKLNRAYLDGPEHTFTARLDAAVTACEAAIANLSRPPDHVLLDSRAGIHDIAAVAITDLSDFSLLFATDSPQTWQGYTELLSQWRTSPVQARLIRERLRMVAAMVPSNPDRQRAYLDSFRDHAHLCLSSALYDDAAADDADAYNPARDDVDAPHSPVPVLFSSDLIALDPAASPHWHRSELVIAAYREFLQTTTGLLTGGAE